MSHTESLDVLTPEGLPTGQTKPRGEVHRDGDWHRAFHLWIVKEGKYVLFQRRARGKDLEPNKLDVTVGGHFAAGETFLEVLREAEEELGLMVRPGALHFLETRQVERHYPNATDREFQDVYVMRCDWALEDYTLDPKEVYVLYEVPLESAASLYRDGTPVAVAGFDAYRRRNDALLYEGDLIAPSRAEVVETLQKIRAWLETADETAEGASASHS